MDKVGLPRGAVSRHQGGRRPRDLARHELSNRAHTGGTQDRQRDLAVREGEVAKTVPRAPDSAHHSKGREFFVRFVPCTFTHTTPSADVESARSPIPTRRTPI